MVIFVKPNGSTVVENDVIGLGTTTRQIAIVAQSRPGAFVEVMFSPPSGVIIPPVYAAPMMSIDAEDLGIYLCDITHGVASVSGKVRYQISFTMSGGGKELTPEGTFTVQPGVVSLPPENPTQSMYEEIRNAMIVASANYTDVVSKLEKALSSSELVEINLEEINAAKSETLQAASGAKSSETAASTSATSAAASASKAETEADRAQTEADRAKSEADRAMESDPTVPAWAKKPNPPTPAEIGAAPAGFGLGEYAKPLTADVDLNTCIKGGWYSWRDSTPINAPDPWCMMEVIPFGSSEACLQRAYCIVFGRENLIRQRFMRGWGTWTEWEWVNPPMLLGVEYRTTERWLGKPVYAKAVDFGALPNNSTKNIKSIPALSTVAEISGTIFYESSSGAIIVQKLEKNGGISEVYISCDEGSVWIATNKDMTKYTAHVIIKYAKN